MNYWGVNQELKVLYNLKKGEVWGVWGISQELEVLYNIITNKNKTGREREGRGWGFRGMGEKMSSNKPLRLKVH